MINRLKLLGALVATLLILAACGKDTTKHTQHYAVNGDLQETTDSLQDLPRFLDRLPAKIIIAYRTAADVKDVLPWIPCYCGCGASAGHQSNLNCFINEIKPDGSVVWDDHGTRCGVCMDTAIMTAQMVADRKTTEEIRQTIDRTYRTGYAKPTPTPHRA